MFGGFTVVKGDVVVRIARLLWVVMTKSSPETRRLFVLATRCLELVRIGWRLFV